MFQRLAGEFCSAAECVEQLAQFDHHHAIANSLIEPSHSLLDCFWPQCLRQQQVCFERQYAIRMTPNEPGVSVQAQSGFIDDFLQHLERRHGRGHVRQ